MKFKEYYARFKIMTSHHSWSNIFKYFENTPSLVMTGHYFKHCYVLLQFLYARLNQ